MREEQRLGEARLAAFDGGIHCNAGETVKRRLLRGVESEGNQRRARRDDAKPRGSLGRTPQAEIRSAASG